MASPTRALRSRSRCRCDPLRCTPFLMRPVETGRLVFGQRRISKRYVNSAAYPSYPHALTGLQIAQHALRGNAREEPGDAPPHEDHHEQGSRSAHIARALASEGPIELYVMVSPK